MQRLKTCRVTHDEEGPVASREELFLKIRGLDDPGREWLALQVSNQLESSRGYLGSISYLHMVDRGSVIIRRDMHRLVLGQPQHQSIVRQYRRHDLGQTRKYIPDVEHVREKTEQILRHAVDGVALAKDRRDVVRERLGLLDRVVAIGPRPAREQSQEASRPICAPYR